MASMVCPDIYPGVHWSLACSQVHLRCSHVFSDMPRDHPYMCSGIVRVPRCALEYQVPIPYLVSQYRMCLKESATVIQCPLRCSMSKTESKVGVQKFQHMSLYLQAFPGVHMLPSVSSITLKCPHGVSRCPRSRHVSQGVLGIGHSCVLVFNTV